MNKNSSNTEAGLQKRIVLVGTYKTGQLQNWCGWYNYPIFDEDKITESDFAKINELWLFNGTKAQQTYTAEFIGVKTREELVKDYGYPAKGKAHGDKYLLFRTEPKYLSDNDSLFEAEKVIIRLKDFATSPKVRKQLKAYLESPDRQDPALANMLPSIVLQVPLKNLCVCEAMVQMDFMKQLALCANPMAAKKRAKINGKFTCLDFFAGSGLVSAAMGNQFETIWANDISEKKAVVFNANIGSNVLDVRPIEDVNGAQLPSVDLSWGSFPCQDLSLAGDMNGLYASRSGLFWHWLRVMDEMEERPPVIVAENVVGLVSAENGRYYITVHEELAKRGYNVGAVMLDAIHWVPQSRKRIFVIAVKENIDISAFTCDAPSWCHPSPVVNVATKVTKWIWWYLPKPTKCSMTVADVIEFNAPCDNEKERNAKLNLIPKEKLESIIKDSKNTCRVYTGYKRTRNHHQVLEVRTDGIAGCLRTPCGGSSRQIVLIAENGNVKARLLTVRETARLMGAPDSFKLPGSYNDGYMAMGDGVVFPVAKYLSENLLAPMVKIAE